MIENCCAFTGHRPHKFPWKYDEADSRCIALKAALTGQINGCFAVEGKKSHAKAPLDSAPRGTGEPVEQFRTGTVSFYSETGRFCAVYQPRLLQWVHA